MSNKQTYPKGRWTLYDSEVKFVLSKSWLSSGATLSMNVNLADKSGLLAVKNQLTGNADGIYKDSFGDSHLATIPYLKHQIALLEDDFLESQQKRIQQGYREVENKMENWPQELRNKKLKLEAKLSVAYMELEECEKRMAAIEEKVEATDDSKCLQFGLKGCGRLRDGRLVEMDGCKVEEISGRLVLTTGLYSGLAISDYRDLMERYQRDLRLDAKEKLLRLQADAEKKGLPVPKQLPYQSNKKVDPLSLPAWPEGCRNWLRKAEDSESSIVRTKHNEEHL